MWANICFVERKPLIGFTWVVVVINIRELSCLYPRNDRKGAALGGAFADVGRIHLPHTFL